MSDVHELTLREYYESFGQSLSDEIKAEEETSIEFYEPEVIYLEYLEGENEEYEEVIEILDDSDNDFNYSMETVRQSPEKPIERLKVHPRADPLRLGKMKAFHRNENDHITRRITRSSKLL